MRTPMPTPLQTVLQPASVLVVDDDSSIRLAITLVLQAAGYEVNTAKHGFDALLQLRTSTPDVIISDLNMPAMSGFEFLSIVRRRFPQVPVVAVSGAYSHAEGVPGGVLADAFYAKGEAEPGELLRMVAELIRTKATRAQAHQQQPAPVWIPRNGEDALGVPFIVITCTECLRSFPMSVLGEGEPELLETPCRYCATPVYYVIDFSNAVASAPSSTVH